MKYVSIFLFVLVAACSGTVPASYQPQSYVKVGEGEMAMGDFIYSPHASGKVKSNQIQNTAIGSVYIATDIARFVQRATALELERGGISIIASSSTRVSGDILEFKADDLGWSVDWSYSIHYKLVNSETGRTLVDKVYNAKSVKTGKFGAAGDFTPSLNEMVLSALEQFMADVAMTGEF